MNNADLGKWHVVEGSESGHCCFELSVLDENGEHVCELWSEHAALISVAPEMYKLLHRISTEMTFAHTSTPNNLLRIKINNLLKKVDKSHNSEADYLSDFKITKGGEKI